MSHHELAGLVGFSPSEVSALLTKETGSHLNLISLLGEWEYALSNGKGFSVHHKSL